MNTLTNAPVYDAQKVGQLLKIELNEKEVAAFSQSPPPRDGYATFFDPGESLRWLRDAVAKTGQIFYPEVWYNNDSFAQAEAPPRYRQLGLEPVVESFGMPFRLQIKLIGSDDEIPSARSALTGMVIHFLATGARLFPNCYVRCSDEALDDRHVIVGLFKGDGLHVSHWGHNHSDGRLGIVPSRKF